MTEEVVNLFQFAQIQEQRADNLENSHDQEESTDKDNDSYSAAATTEEGDTAVIYQDVMNGDYELNDTRIAMVGNVDSGKVHSLHSIHQYLMIIDIVHFTCSDCECNP